jgi:uncharacterized membrane protein YeiH
MEQLLVNLYWITFLAVIVSSASVVLKAGFKKFDLFGVIIAYWLNQVSVRLHKVME